MRRKPGFPVLRPEWKANNPGRCRWPHQKQEGVWLRWNIHWAKHPGWSVSKNSVSPCEGCRRWLQWHYICLWADWLGQNLHYDRLYQELGWKRHCPQMLWVHSGRGQREQQSRFSHHVLLHRIVQWRNKRSTAWGRENKAWSERISWTGPLHQRCQENGHHHRRIDVSILEHWYQQQDNRYVYIHSAETLMNSESSRSHSIFTIYV